MRFRYSIPAMGFLLAIASVVGWRFDFNLVVVVVVATSVAFAYDASRIDTQRYEGVMGQPPLAVAAVTLLAWPLAFPLYLSLRRRIVDGHARERTAEDHRIAPAAVIAVVALAATQAAVWYRSMSLAREARELVPLAAAAAMTDVSVSRTGRSVIISVSAQSAADSVTERRVAEYVARRSLAEWAGSERLETVTVQFVNTVRRGSVTTTTIFDRFDWSNDDLLSHPKRPMRGTFSISFEGLTVVSKDCIGTGSYDLWTDDAEAIGGGSGTITCSGKGPSMGTPRDLYLRLGGSMGEGTPGRLDIGFSGYEGATSSAQRQPCNGWDQCACQILLASPPISGSLACAMADGPFFTAMLSLAPDPQAAGAR